MKSILIKNGQIWDGDRFFRGDILTEGDRIARIADHIDDPADYVFDADGKIVSPGLVDAHVHMRGIYNDTYGIQAEMSCFPFGVTAAAEAGGGHGDKKLLDSFMVKNLMFVSVAVKNNHADFSRTERKLADYGDKAIGLKIYFDATPELWDITPLRETCEFARAKGLQVMVHCSRTPVKMTQIIEVLSPGDILTHVFHGGENTAVDDGFACLRLAKEKGVVLDTGFAAQVHTDFRVFTEAVKAGFLPDTISTDITKFSAYTRGGRYGMTMCMSMARAAGMQEEDIFRCVTSAPARVLGKEAEWGYFAVGRKADIAVLEYTDEGFDMTDNAGNRLHSEMGYRCIFTVADGQIIYKH